MILVEHDPYWKQAFQELAACYRAVLGELVLAVEHVGSTAISGIVAKPILDIDLVIADDTLFPEVKRCLESHGYRHNGDQGVAERQVFKRIDTLVPHFGEARLWMHHHLYVCPIGSRELMRHITFRDYLNQHEEARIEYQKIKHEIAARSNGDRKVYATIKEREGVCREFIETILATSAELR